MAASLVTRARNNRTAPFIPAWLATCRASLESPIEPPKPPPTARSARDWADALLPAGGLSHIAQASPSQMPWLSPDQDLLLSPGLSQNSVNLYSSGSQAEPG